MYPLRAIVFVIELENKIGDFDVYLIALKTITLDNTLIPYTYKACIELHCAKCAFCSKFRINLLNLEWSDRTSCIPKLPRASLTVYHQVISYKTNAYDILRGRYV